MEIRQPFLSLSDEANDILLTLLYFNIFNHPLTQEELRNSSKISPLSDSSFEGAIGTLLQRKLIFEKDGFWGVQENISFLVERRKDLNQRAAKYMPIAHKISALIGRFPFVRAVCVSGSLSKGIMAADGDIDYFIITEPHRLWLARTLLILFKKVFLLNSHKYFCVNYFIDSHHLEIEDKNLFTATELAFLLPTWGKGVITRFYQANHWVKDFYPNFPIRTDPDIPIDKRRLKKILEWVFSGRMGGWLDDQCMKITTHYQAQKFKPMKAEDYSVALRAFKHTSKHHPRHFQRRVLEKYAAQIASLKTKIERH